MNNSSTGGILLPNPQPPTLNTSPPNLSLTEFLQMMFVGLSGFPGNLVRPQWQVEPPKEPDICVNWMGFGIGTVTPDNNAYVGFTQATEQVDQQPFLQRNELLQVTICVYGPKAYDNVGLIRDGFQLTQNLTSLRQAQIGFAYDTPAQHLPELIGERWFDRYITDFFFRRQILRTYPILNFVSASGIIHAQTATDSNFTQNWETGS